MKACVQLSWLGNKHHNTASRCVVVCCGTVLCLGIWIVQSHIVLFCAATYAHCTTINPCADYLLRMCSERP